MSLSAFIQGFYIAGGLKNLCIVEFIKGFAQGIGFIIPILIIGMIFKKQIKDYFRKE